MDTKTKPVARTAAMAAAINLEAPAVEAATTTNPTDALERLAARRKADAAELTAQSRRRYLTLLKQPALTTAEASELEKLAPAVGKSIDEMIEDAKVFRRLREYGDKASKLEAAAAAEASAMKSLRKITEDTTAIVTSAQAKLQQARAEAESASRARAIAETAADDLRRLSRERNDLTGEPGPAELAKRRHVAQMIFGADLSGKDPDIEVTSIEQLMEYTSHRRLAGIELVKMRGQSDADLGRLSDIVRRLQAEPSKRGRYLALAADAGQIRGAGVVVFSDPPQLDPHFDPDEYLWIELPGQTPEQLAARMEEFRTRVEKNWKAIGHKRAIARAGGSERT